MNELMRKMYPGTPLSDKELAEVESIWGATTKGNWHIEGSTYRISTDFISGVYVASEGDRGVDIEHYDAFWMCQAHNEHIPRLLATIEARSNDNKALLERLDSLEKLVELARSWRAMHHDGTEALEPEADSAAITGHMYEMKERERNMLAALDAIK